MKIALIGCSGSIGRQAAEVVRELPAHFCFSALIGGSDAASLEALSAEFHPDFAGLASGGEVRFPAGTRLLKGEDILLHAFDGADVALIAASGFAGLQYTLRAAELGIKIALANKESLVCGGELVTSAVKKSGSALVPVDSEHSALFQALNFRRDTPFEKLILTASGGPFFKLSEGELRAVTAADALRHPTWKMGPKITIDSATLLNKGYEVIEARWLYDAPFESIEAVVHPESIVHSLVSFQDGAMMAQLGYPDMKLPIQLALTYPERLPCVKQLDLVSLGALHFYPLPKEKFPCYSLALAAGKAGGTAPAVLNGAAEIAVSAFLKGEISFPRIAEVIDGALQKVPREDVSAFEQLAEVDARARRFALSLL